MGSGPKITGIEVHQFRFQKEDIARDENGGIVYSPGARSERTAYALRILTDTGPVGEYVGGMAADYAALPSFVDILIGANALHRELIYARVGHAMRMNRIGIAPIDIALWDLAGKYHDAPHPPAPRRPQGDPADLRGHPGTARRAATGGLDSPEAYADFAQQCLEAGYPGYKIHGWEDGYVPREIETVHRVAERVGGRMDMMLDPYNALVTFGDAVKVGRACDEAGYFWYEDPFLDMGTSMFAHRKLRQLIKHSPAQSASTYGASSPTSTSWSPRPPTSSGATSRGRA